ncbi:damage-inducible protein J [Finegoldia magna]|uniref:Damage-inducible protein J n=1 Tax=Finegoldia magna TaxID=1260 RepID=A0A233VWN4_FINMA|nr:type II toxin-antitoxin system RelB/DinJ family antitoxin [Finegoldia magna]EXF27219.1 damage-inducible protein J [Finegoldia magna ALB8]MDU5272400.1 type II toxin-antitoxin system RelB/DinJ family antitoxin [Finegoldia magna]MDU6880593.1 type II toxin-antitoxin system RelB/DinJ family antitoxin [Finegoldia magna]OXZ36803.1 damage-inducible protein J [Finegoldia magna]
MSTVNLNIRTDKEIKEKAENIFQELGLNMTTAINMFLRTSIRENGIPFDLKIDTVNDETKLAIEEGRKIADDKTIEGYVSIEELKKALENLR